MWFCTQCGQQNTDSFCSRCGAAKPVAPDQGQAAPQYTYQAPPPPPPPAYQPAQPYQPQYAYPPQPKPDSTVTLGEWIITLIVFAIPLVGFIMMLVWAFGSDTKPSKANFCKASLIMMLIGVAIGIIVSIAMGTVVWSLIHSISYYG